MTIIRTVTRTMPESFLSGRNMLYIVLSCLQITLAARTHAYLLCPIIKEDIRAIGTLFHII